MRLELINAGWKSYENTVMPADAGATQVAETRRAFYAGAAVLFYTIMRALDPGEEPTANDLQRMDDIQTEIDEFGAELDATLLLPQGEG